MSKFKLFVAGVHGVGKSTFCNFCIEQFPWTYISASSLLNWKSKNKCVNDISANQILLVNLINTATSEDKYYLIDGHCVLLNSDKTIEEINGDVFHDLGINAIVVITTSAKTIKRRLWERDKIVYNLALIRKMQELEIQRSKAIAQSLKIPQYIVNSSDEESKYIIFKQIIRDMTKYTRKNIHSKMLKTVIMRFDFIGNTNITRFVDEIKQTNLMKAAFISMRPIQQNQCRIDIGTSTNKCGLPLTEKQSSVVYHFTDCRLDNNDNVFLDISNDNICLVIDCSQGYQGSEKYTNFIGSLIYKLKEFDSYISIQRIGIRKIDMQEIIPPHKINDYFNEKFISATKWYSKPPKDKIVLTELLTLGRVNFNISQNIDKTVEGNDRVIYDVDAYIKDSDISQIIKSDEQLIYFLNKEMQDQMFKMFVDCISEDYLKSCLIGH